MKDQKNDRAGQATMPGQKKDSNLNKGSQTGTSVRKDLKDRETQQGKPNR